MGKKSDAFDKSLRIRYRGQYDYDGLIALLRSFYVRCQIMIEEPKFKYKGQDNGKYEVEFVFTGDVKVSQYVKIYMTITGHAFDVDPKEVVVNGVKKRMTEGKIELYFSGQYELDWGDGFKVNEKHDSALKKAALKQMKKFIDEDYEGIMYEEHKNIGKDSLKGLIKKFHNDTAKFLGMECV